MHRFLNSLEALYITLAIAGVALLLALLALILLFMIRRMTERRLSILLERSSGQPGEDRVGKVLQELERMRQTIEEYVSFNRDTRTQGEVTGQALNEVVRVLADSRSEQLILGEQEGGNERLALRQIYEAVRSELAPFTSSLLSVTPSVDSLNICPTHNNVTLVSLIRELVLNYQQIQTLDTEIVSKIARVSDGESIIASVIADARCHFESGLLAKETYLQQILSIQPPDRQVLPDPAAESSHYRELAAQTTDNYLGWLERINELREMASESECVDVASACTQIIRQSRSVLEVFHVELENVEIGRTQYDSRLHDLLHAIPRPGVRPETIIGIRKLGYRRNGKTVCKPQVVVAASGN